MDVPTEVGEFMEKIKTNEEIFSSQAAAKDLVLDFEVGENLDSDGFANFGDLI